MNDKYGDICHFDVAATCPYCEEDTYVSQEELHDGEVLCQYCEANFRVTLD